MAGITMGIINKNYISALDPSLDVREIDHTVYDIWREDNFTDILGISDRKEPVAQPFYVSWTDNQLFYQVIAGTTITGSGTSAVTVLLTSGTSGIARKGQVVYLPDNTTGIITGLTTSTGVDTIVITTDNGTLTVTTGMALGLGVIIVGERADAPTNARFGYTKYSNKYSIFSEVSQISDVQNAGKLEAVIDGNDTVMFKDHLDKLKVLKGGINFEMIMGQISTTSFSDATPTLTDPTVISGGGGGGAVQRTRGLVQYINSYGTMLSAVGSGTSGSPVPNGTVALQDFNNVGDSLIASRAPEDQLVLSNQSVRRAFDILLKNLSSSGVTSVRLNIGGKELDCTVDKLSYGGFNYNFVNLPILNHSNISKTAAGKSAHFLPLDYKVPVYTEGKGVSEKPCLAVRYVANTSGRGNEMIMEAYTGTLAPIPNGSINEFRTIWSSKQGFEFKAPTFGLSLKVNA